MLLTKEVADINNNAPLRVALIFGGRGHERAVSEKSAEYVFSVTDKEKISFIPIRITESGKWLMADKSDSSLSECVFDTEIYPAHKKGKHGFISDKGFVDVNCALPVLHGDFGEDGTVQGALECAGIKYVGCGVVCGAVCSDKSCTKAVAEHLGIPVTRWISASRSDDVDSIVKRAEADISYPAFVKPIGLGSSIGASSAYDRCSLVRAVTDALSVSDRIMIEKCVSIRAELECAYLGTGGTEIFSDIGMIECDGTYDYESKYLSSLATVSDVCDIDASLRRRITEYSDALRRELNIRHLSRFDFFLTYDGGLIFNEINTFPGFTASSLYPRLISRTGISPSELIYMLARDAAES